MRCDPGTDKLIIHIYLVKIKRVYHTNDCARFPDEAGSTPESRASAASCTMNSLEDHNDGACILVMGDCTLLELNTRNGPSGCAFCNKSIENPNLITLPWTPSSACARDTPMTQTNMILTVLEILSIAYPDRPRDKQNIDLYLEHLGDIPAHLLRAAASYHIQHSAWFPKICELRQAAAHGLRCPLCGAPL
jgi:hypothetical protein